MAKILVIDDEGIVRDALKAVLSPKGHQVLAAADGETGVVLFGKERPDLVILDRDLPRMTGSEVLRALRALDPDARVIVLTGHAEDGGEKYRKLGVSAFLSKGMGLEALMRIIEREVERTPAPTAARILVVDDEASVRDLLKKFLEKKGYEVSTVTNGHEALAAVERFSPDLILLDLEMPVLNGVETLRSLRRAGKDVAVIMVTGNQDLETAKETLELGACDYIVKPFNWDYLEMSVWAKIMTAAP